MKRRALDLVFFKILSDIEPPKIGTGGGDGDGPPWRFFGGILILFLISAFIFFWGRAVMSYWRPILLIFTALFIILFGVSIYKNGYGEYPEDQERHN